MLCRKLRPKAKWGFYGLPLNAMNDCQNVTGKPGAPKSCGYLAAGSDADELRRAAEVTQLPVWRASTALFPSIYLATPFRNRSVTVAEAYIDSTVSESVKVAALAASADGLENPIPVFPYAWDHYHAGVHVLPKESLVANMQVSKQAGARGVVWWGSGRVAGNATYWAWFKSVEGLSRVLPKPSRRLLMARLLRSRYRPLRRRRAGGIGVRAESARSAVANESRRVQYARPFSAPVVCSGLAAGVRGGGRGQGRALPPAAAKANYCVLYSYFCTTYAMAEV